MDKKKEKQSVLQLLFGFMDRANGDHVGAYAAQAAYFLIMSFIPFILFLTTIIRYTPLTYNMVSETIRAFVPHNIQNFVLTIVSEVYGRSTAVVPISAIMALWSAGKAMQSLTNGLNSIYHVHETRNWLITRMYAVKSAMAGIGTEIKQREPAIAETEQRITELEQQLEKGRLIDERIKKLKERRSTGRVASADRADAGRTRPERPDYREIENADRRIADLEREVKQREQNREHSSLKERLEENKRIVAERERENARCRNHDRGMSR